MKSTLILFTLGMVLAITVTACQRPASVAPTVIPEDTEVTTSPEEIIQMTQTAVAEPVVQVPTATPEPPVEAGTPTAPILVATMTSVPPTATAPVIPTLTVPSTYTLKDNEHPYCIARRFNIDIGELLSLNDLTTFSVTSPGTTLKIPTSGHPWSSGQRYLISHPTSHTVAAGETIYTIACKYGDVSPEAIIAANGLTDPFTLTAGQSINIP